MLRLRLAFAFVFALIGLAATHAAAQQPLRLWYKQPAEKWTDALPIGTGRLGGMVFGGVQQEQRKQAALLRARYDRQAANGAIEFEGVGRLRNSWASRFAWQALRFLGDAQIGRTADRMAAALI